jgi:hypothetical protein
MYFFGADYRCDIRLAISPTLSEGQAHLEKKGLAVDRFIGATRQTTGNKKLIHPSVLLHF